MVSVWANKRTNNNKKKENKVSPIDAVLAKLKIVIGFYQVIYGLLETFSYIAWPDSLQITGTYLEILLQQLLLFLLLNLRFIFRVWIFLEDPVKE